MVSLTLSISDDLKRKMSHHSEIKWSEVVRSILEKQIKDIEEADNIASKSMLTEKDIEEMSAEIDKNMAKRWKNASRR